MKSTGVVRKIDQLGRIVIPMEIRRTQNWEVGTSMEFFSSEEGLLIRQYQPSIKEHGSVLKELDALLMVTTSQHARDSIQKAMEIIKDK